MSENQGCALGSLFERATREAGACSRENCGSEWKTEPGKKNNVGREERVTSYR